MLDAVKKPTLYLLIKNDKQSVKNYRPVSPLPIYGETLKRLLYNKMFSFFNENVLISQNQSGFKPGDSWIYQLLSITHEIYKSVDDVREIRDVSLDISKAFNKVCNQGVQFKLKQNGISGNFLKILENVIAYWFQRIVWNGQVSRWAAVNAGGPQRSILGILLFLIYINDLSPRLSSNP